MCNAIRLDKAARGSAVTWSSRYLSQYNFYSVCWSRHVNNDVKMADVKSEEKLIERLLQLKTR